MPAPRPLPFDRVRVIAAADAGADAAALRRRTPVLSVHPIERIRLDAKPERRALSAAVPAGAAAPQASGCQPVSEPLDIGTGEAAAGPGEDAADRVLPGAKQPEAIDLVEPPDEPAPDPEPVRQELPVEPELRGQSRVRPEMAAPVAAVAKAVKDVRYVQALAELLLDTCGDEALRDTGPWAFSLHLKSVGMGESSVDLQLSRELLQLRFQCRGEGVADLLSRRKDTLLTMLQRELPGSPDIEITLVQH